MRKLENLGKLLSDAQQKTIKGGGGADCVDYGDLCDPGTLFEVGKCCAPTSCKGGPAQGGYYCVFS